MGDVKTITLTSFTEGDFTIEREEDDLIFTKPDGLVFILSLDEIDFIQRAIEIGAL